MLPAYIRNNYLMRAWDFIQIPTQGKVFQNELYYKVAYLYACIGNIFKSNSSSNYLYIKLTVKL